MEGFYKFFILRRAILDLFVFRHSIGQKKHGVIEKLKAFFEKYFGLGIAEFRAEEQEQSVVYEIEPSYQMVAEENAQYGEKK